MERVLSGMRPTGKLHLGHLAGALTNWVKLQENYDCYYSIVDWHAMMSDYEDSSMIRQNCTEVLLDWLASGIDPEKSCVFIQSHVHEHAELALALGMVTPLGWLFRNPIYKEQLRNIENRDIQNYAFLGYPILMAADILLYKAGIVPVGEDQDAHLELSREIARRFNHFFGENRLPEPEMLLTPTPKVPGTDGRKMSKSYNNSLLISEDADSMWTKLKTMVTDPARIKRTDPGDPEKCPVWDIQKVFNNDEQEMLEIAANCRSAGIGCVDCKKKLNGHVERVMAPIHERRKKYENSPKMLSEILNEGAKRARKVANETMLELREAMGLIIET
jgi:tryptophanyl-tRNA synthetase